MGFYNTQNLATFGVNNPQIKIWNAIDDLRQFQYHQIGIQNAFPQVSLTELDAIDPQSATSPLELTLDEVINGAKNLYYTEDYTGAFDGDNEFVPSQVKRFYVNYLPNSLMQNTNTKFPSDYAVAANFGFKVNNGYRYYSNELPEGATAENATESHIFGIPENFGIAPTFRVGRGTEILLMWNNPFETPVNGVQPLRARYLLRNAIDWLSAGLLKGPGSSAYNPNLYFPSDPAPQTTYPNGSPIAGVPTNGVVFAPEPYGLSTQWFY
jgi:hypothetical protein